MAVTAGVVIGFTAAQGVAEHRAEEGLPPVLGRVTSLHGVAASDHAGGRAYLPVTVTEARTDRGVFELSRRVVLDVGEHAQILRGSSITATVRDRAAAQGNVTRFVAATSHRARATGAVALRGRLRAAVSEVAAAGDLIFMAPLLIGSREALSEGTVELFRRAGALHMLALSGMHVALLVGLVYLVMRGFGSWRLSVAAAMLFVLFFLWVAGPRPSLVRAVVLTLLASGALLTGRKSAPMNFLALTFLLMAIGSPGSATQLSFHLSFLALVGILVVAPTLDWVLDGWVPAWLRKPVAVGGGAQIATAPVAAVAFGAVYPVGALITVVLAPIVTLYLWGCVAATAVHALGFTALRTGLLHALRMGEVAILQVVGLGARAPGLAFETQTSWVLGGAILMAFAVLVLDVARRRHRGALLLARRNAAAGGA
jgi:ComEC/Rec2-related protein